MVSINFVKAQCSYIIILNLFDRCQTFLYLTINLILLIALNANTHQFASLLVNDHISPLAIKVSYVMRRCNIGNQTSSLSHLWSNVICHSGIHKPWSEISPQFRNSPYIISNGWTANESYLFKEDKAIVSVVGEPTMLTW